MMGIQKVEAQLFYEFDLDADVGRSKRQATPSDKPVLCFWNFADVASSRKYSERLGDRMAHVAQAFL